MLFKKSLTCMQLHSNLKSREEKNHPFLISLPLLFFWPLHILSPVPLPIHPFPTHSLTPCPPLITVVVLKRRNSEGGTEKKFRLPLHNPDATPTSRLSSHAVLLLTNVIISFTGTWLILAKALFVNRIEVLGIFRNHRWY